MLKKIILILLALAVLAPAQTVESLRSSGPAGAYAIGLTSGTGGQALVQTDQPHGFNPGDKVLVEGVRSTQGGSQASPVNGIRYVASVPDTTHFYASYVNGTPITAAMTCITEFTSQDQGIAGSLYGQQQPLWSAAHMIEGLLSPLVPPQIMGLMVGDYGGWDDGTLSIYKVGYLIGNDNLPNGGRKI